MAKSIAEQGGYAFPSSVADPPASGMTLRDWFAGHALAGMDLAGGLARGDAAARIAYQTADKLLAHREGTGES